MSRRGGQSHPQSSPAKPSRQSPVKKRRDLDTTTISASQPVPNSTTRIAAAKRIRDSHDERPSKRSKGREHSSPYRDAYDWWGEIRSGRRRSPIERSRVIAESPEPALPSGQTKRTSGDDVVGDLEDGSNSGSEDSDASDASSDVPPRKATGGSPKVGPSVVSSNRFNSNNIGVVGAAFEYVAGDGESKSSDDEAAGETRFEYVDEPEDTKTDSLPTSRFAYEPVSEESSGDETSIRNDPGPSSSRPRTSSSKVHTYSSKEGNSKASKAVQPSSTARQYSGSQSTKPRKASQAGAAKSSRFDYSPMSDPSSGSETSIPGVNRTLNNGQCKTAYKLTILQSQRRRRMSRSRFQTVPATTM
jgi:hypothetical protein